jgi:hypothetical protein
MTSSVSGSLKSPRKPLVCTGNGWMQIILFVASAQVLCWS